jgi:hypothetical protein
VSGSTVIAAAFAVAAFPVSTVGWVLSGISPADTMP